MCIKLVNCKIHYVEFITWMKLDSISSIRLVYFLIEFIHNILILIFIIKQVIFLSFARLDNIIDFDVILIATTFKQPENIYYHLNYQNRILRILLQEL